MKGINGGIVRPAKQTKICAQKRTVKFLIISFKVSNMGRELNEKTARRVIGLTL